MKIRIHTVIALCGLTAILAMAQDPGLEGTWVTEGVPTVEAAKKAGKSLNNLPEGTRIKFKVDKKKNKISGTITQLNADKEYDIEDGKLMGNTFTFKSVEVVAIGNFGNRAGRGGPDFGGNAAPAPLSWKGEFTDTNTVTLTKLSDSGEAAGTVVLHRASK